MELSELIKICQFSGFALCIIALTMVFNFIRSIFKEPSSEIYSRLNMLEQWYHELNQDLNIAKIEGDKSLDGICNSINATDQSVIDLTKRVDQHKQIINENFKEANRREQLLENRDNQLLAICETHRIEINKLCRKKSEAKRSRS